MMPIKAGRAGARGDRPARARSHGGSLLTGLVSDEVLAAGVVAAAVLFNAGLALVNATLAPLSAGVVIGCEAALTAAAGLLSIRGPTRDKRIWVALAGLIVAFGLANGFGTGGFDPKFIRDVVLIPVFVLLGLSVRRETVLRTMLILQLVILSVMLIEALRPEEFGRFFNVISYYINTRGFQTESFWNTESDLFVSATRPGERFLFAGLDIHRLSSVFLEPVSLGNYSVIVAIVVAACWDGLSLARRLFFLGSTAVILIGCDGRFATVSIALVIALRVVAPALPRHLNALYLPGLLAVAAAAVAVLHLSPEGDDFPSRMAGSIVALSRMSTADLMGYTTYRAYTVMDSGISYLVYSQSLLGAAVIWGVIALGLPQAERRTVFTAHAISAYVALNLLVSYSMFSIKTAALLWFSYGALMRPAEAAAATRLRRLRPAEAQGPLAA